MSMGSEQSYIAYPYGPDVNDVMLFDVLNLKPIGVIRASKGAVSALSFNPDGTLLATASVKVKSVGCSQGGRGRRGIMQ